MDEPEALACVHAAARALKLPLDDAAARRVAQHLARTAQMAQLLEDAQLGPQDEPAEIFRPAPFPDLAGPGQLP
jgi:hypothetical protein